MNKPKIPAYRRQKDPNGARAFVLLDGKRHYLGEYRSKESRQRYNRLIAEWLAGGGQAPAGPEPLTIVELIARYWKHAEAYYVGPDSAPTHEQTNIRLACAVLRRLYEGSEADNFGPLSLKAVRQAMIADGGGRRYVNQQIGRLKRMFKWAVENELVKPSVYHGLAAVAGLRMGRTTAKESVPVHPVADAVVDATLPHLPPTVQTMVQLQRHTGMRPIEVCLMRTGDIDQSGAVWIYRPQRHKTQHHGRTRQVFIGPNGKRVLQDWLKPDLQAYLFTPHQAMQERREARHKARITPAGRGNEIGTNRRCRPQWAPGQRYTSAAYHRAIRWACDLAWPFQPDAKRDNETDEQYVARIDADRKVWQREHRWSPNQLRHSFATTIRKQFGLDATQVLLGHSKADVTQIYAEVDQQKALLVAAKIG